MAPLHPDRPRRALSGMPWLVMLLAVATAHGARAVPGKLEVSFDELKELNLNAGTLVANDIEIRGDQGTLIKADQAHGSQITDSYENSHWTLTGRVHIEYDGGVLDADSANVTFANQLVKSIEVHGTPAQFSRPARKAGQTHEGRADSIYFDGDKRLVRFTGRPWFSLGRIECTSDKPLVYSLDSSVLNSEGNGNPQSRLSCASVADKDRHVPAPRAPDRSNAQ